MNLLAPLVCRERTSRAIEHVLFMIILEKLLYHIRKVKKMKKVGIVKSGSKTAQH